MANIYVDRADDVNSASDGQATLREALAQAATNPGVDKIFLRPDVDIVSLDDPLTVADGDGVVINGDADNDGVSDVRIYGGSGPIIENEAGSKLTVIGTDLHSGHDAGKARGTDGARGVDGSNGEGGRSVTQIITDDLVPGPFGSLQLAPYAGMNGENGHSAGSDGTDGSAGGRGEDAAGAIMNKGDLTLIRSSISNSDAAGGFGGNGGDGGFAANGGAGYHGIEQWSQDDVRYNFDTGKYEFIGPGAVTSPQYSIDGGNGGDAADAIFNGPSGTVTLVDVGFGGATASGRFGHGNAATDGNGGLGGFAGNGRGGGGAGQDNAY